MHDMHNTGLAGKHNTGIVLIPPGMINLQNLKKTNWKSHITVYVDRSNYMSQIHLQFQTYVSNLMRNKLESQHLQLYGFSSPDHTSAAHRAKSTDIFLLFLWFQLNHIPRGKWRANNQSRTLYFAKGIFRSCSMAEGRAFQER